MHRAYSERRRCRGAPDIAGHATPAVGTRRGCWQRAELRRRPRSSFSAARRCKGMLRTHCQHPALHSPLARRDSLPHRLFTSLSVVLALRRPQGRRRVHVWAGFRKAVAACAGARSTFTSRAMTWPELMRCAAAAGLSGRSAQLCFFFCYCRGEAFYQREATPTTSPGLRICLVACA